MVCHGASRFEDAEFLQRSAEATWVNSEALGDVPLFGVSGWIVSAVEEPIPEGYARVSTLMRSGFRVVSTPHLGRPGHVTILLDDPVNDEQAFVFNECFGRSP